MPYMRDSEGVRLDTISMRRFIEYDGWSVITNTPNKASATITSSTETAMTCRTECVPPLNVRAIRLGYANFGTGIPVSAFAGEMPNANPIIVRASLQPQGATINEAQGDPVYRVTFGGLDTLILGRGKFALSDPIKYPGLAGVRFFVKTYVSSGMPAAPSAPTVAFSGGSTSQFAAGNVVNVSITYAFPSGIESAASVTAPATCSVSGTNLVVTSPSNPNNGAIGYRVFCSQRGVASPCYDSSQGIIPFGTNATIGGLVPAGTEPSVEQVLPTGLTYLPLGVSTLGGTAAGASNNGEISGQASGIGAGDRTGEGYAVTGAPLSSFVFSPAIILGKSGNQIMRSCALIGDSICQATADYGFGVLLGGFQKRAVMGQLAQAAYDATVVPTMGHVWVPQGSETMLQFASTAGYKRSLIAAHCTSIWSNYGTNDKTFGLAPLVNATLVVANRFINQGKTFIQSDLLPNTNSTDGWSTVANQSLVTGVGEATRRGFNLWLADQTGAVTVSGEALFNGTGSGQAPTFNPYGGGNGTGVAFYSQFPFRTGTEAVTVAGVAKVVTTDYTYLFTQTINGVQYASGIQFGSAPANGAAVLMSYTKIAGYQPSLGALAKYLPVAIAVEVNAAGVPTLNGGWWWPAMAASLGPKTLTGSTSTSLTDSSQTWTQDQWRGYTVRIVTDSVTPAAVGLVNGILSNTPTALSFGTTWATTPSTSATYVIVKGPTQDGTHPTTTSHLLLANQAITSGLLNTIV